MKLVFAIVNNDDSHAVTAALAANGVFTTKLASTGGFLMAGNTTFLICAEDDKVDMIIDVIKEKCHRRKQSVHSPSFSAPDTVPVEITVGGATVFVTDVERFEKA